MYEQETAWLAKHIESLEVLVECPVIRDKINGVVLELLSDNEEQR